MQSVQPAPRAPSGLVLVALAHASPDGSPSFLNSLRESWGSVYVTHGYFGCLRAVAAMQPDVIYLDAALPDRLSALVRAHPNGRRALMTTFDAACR